MSRDGRSFFAPCKNDISAIHGGRILEMHRYMDVVGRATQDAKAEEQFLGFGQEY